jgi:hypothetical protein
VAEDAGRELIFDNNCNAEFWVWYNRVRTGATASGRKG